MDSDYENVLREGKHQKNFIEKRIIQSTFVQHKIGKVKFGGKKETEEDRRKLQQHIMVDINIYI